MRKHIVLAERAGLLVLATFLMKKIQAQPPIQFKDLQQVVTTRVTYSALPFRFGYELLQFDETHSLVPVRVALRDADLGFKQEPSGVRRAVVHVYGKVSALNNRTIREFEDTVVREIEPDGAASGIGVVQRNLLLASGRYKLSLVVRDGRSGNMQTEDFSVFVPAVGGFSASSVLVAERIRKARPDQIADPLVLSGYKIFPSLERKHRRGQDVELFLELYNFSRDQSTVEPSLRVETRILKDGRDWPPADKVLDQSLNHSELLADRMLVMKKIPTTSMEPGTYRILMAFTDQIAGQIAVASAAFEVVP